MADKKLCPLKFVRNTPESEYCSGKNCAWFINNRCAIFVIAEDHMCEDEDIDL